MFFRDSHWIRYIDADGYARLYVDLHDFTTELGAPPYPLDLAFDADGFLLVLLRAITAGGDPQFQVVRLTSPTSLEHVAGNGSVLPVTGALAADVDLDSGGVNRMAADADGNIYLSGQRRGDTQGSSTVHPFGIHVIRPDGRWEVLLRPSTDSCSLDGATPPGATPIGGTGRVDDEIYVCDVTALQVGPDGSLYFAEVREYQDAAHAPSAVRRITPGGRVEDVAGRLTEGAPLTDPDVQGRFDGYLEGVSAMAVSFDGSVVFSVKHGAPDWNYELWAVTGAGTLRHLGGVVASAGAPRGDVPVARLRFFGISELHAMPDHSVLLGQRACLLQLQSGYGAELRNRWGLSGLSDEVAVASEDGSAVHFFDLDGRHLRTQGALSSALLRTFGYDTEGRLTTVADCVTADCSVANTTTLTWPSGPSDPLTIRAPFGQETHVLLDADGYVREVVDPEAGQWIMTYQSGAAGILETFTDPLGRVHTYTHGGTLGELTWDVGPGGPGEFRQLALEEELLGVDVDEDGDLDRVDGWRVTTTSGEGAVTTYSNLRPSRGPREQVITAPTGLTSRVLRYDDDHREIELPQEGPGGQHARIIEHTEPDPRFGRDAPVPSVTEIVLPDGRRSCATTSRTYDPGSEDFVETTTAWEGSGTAACASAPADARVSTAAYTASTRTWLFTSPEGIERSIVLDAQGRATHTVVRGMATARASYDALGRLERAWQTDSSGVTRELELGYDAGSGYLRTLRDAADATTRVATDPLGQTDALTIGWDRVADAPGPDAETTGFRQDAAGNLVGLTPFGRPEHEMGYGPRDDLTIHETPVVGGLLLRSTWATDGDGRPTSHSVGLYEDDGSGTYTVPDPATNPMNVSYSYYPSSDPEPAGRRGRLESMKGSRISRRGGVRGCGPRPRHPG